MQIAFLYFLALVWNADLLFGFIMVVITGDIQNIFNNYFLETVFEFTSFIIIFFIPILYLYALFRVAYCEKAFVSKHPLMFFGAIGAAVLPPFVIFLIIFFKNL
jgi:hypothetical protein